MPPASGHGDGTLSRWLEANGYDEQPRGPDAIADVARVRRLLLDAARAGHAVSYSGLLRDLGHRFTRPKMRALCRTLDAIDRQAAPDGEPPLAVLVVREGDRLPGQGWWLGAAQARGYRGGWEGSEAVAFVRAQQQRAFDFWATR
ncbi:ribose-phosphate pyrophosphokinase [Sphingomonas adhaesiva]|uniref:ribose-phosphate pyrophosphokinase n=1 Tax=Sphingomonas adhaesiva TaxID=28212 RepID=UPI002FF9A0CF